MLVLKRQHPESNKLFPPCFLPLLPSFLPSSLLLFSLPLFFSLSLIYSFFFSSYFQLSFLFFSGSLPHVDPGGTLMMFTHNNLISKPNLAGDGLPSDIVAGEDTLHITFMNTLEYASPCKPCG